MCKASNPKQMNRLEKSRIHLIQPIGVADRSDIQVDRNWLDRIDSTSGRKMFCVAYVFHLWFPFARKEQRSRLSGRSSGSWINRVASPCSPSWFFGKWHVMQSSPLTAAAPQRNFTVFPILRMRLRIAPAPVSVRHYIQCERKSK